MEQTVNKRVIVELEIQCALQILGCVAAAYVKLFGRVTIARVR